MKKKNYERKRGKKYPKLLQIRTQMTETFQVQFRVIPMSRTTGIGINLMKMLRFKIETIKRDLKLILKDYAKRTRLI